MTRTTNTSVLESVQEALQECDAMAQHGLDNVNSLARLALLGLKSGKKHDLEHVEVALNLIREIASCIKNDINARAEECGCNHVEVAA